MSEAKYPAIEKAMTEMLKKAKTFEEHKLAIDTAIKFETLKLKSKGSKWGQGFKEGGEDDDID